MAATWTRHVAIQDLSVFLRKNGGSGVGFG